MSDQKTKSTMSFNSTMSPSGDKQKDLENKLQDIIVKIEEMVMKNMEEFIKRHHPIDDGNNFSNDGSSLQSQLERLHKNLKQIEEALTKLKEFEKEQLGEQITAQLSFIEAFLERENNKIADSTKNLQEINKKLKKLQFHIPPVRKLVSSEGSSAHGNSKASSGSNVFGEAPKLPKPHESEIFQNSFFYKDIKGIFDGLDKMKKFCLWCFSVFPENELVKRRVLTYWLIGEGFFEEALLRGTGEYAPTPTPTPTPEKPTPTPTPEKIVDGILEELKEQGLIEPAKGKRGRHTKSYRMHPLVRSAVILISQQKRLQKCDSMGNLTANLPESGLLAYFMKADEGSLKPDSTKNTDDVKYQTLFNVNEPFPVVNLELLGKTSNVNVVSEWSLKLKNANVLYLGRWQKSDQKHIEVESSEFLKGLKNTGELRLLSLQWISRIDELPKSIGSLQKLLILDLKACHNLFLLPKEITSLKKLIYMDVSECYLLEHMPKRLSSLSELQVLKGFVIGNRLDRSWGTLDDLKGLKKLRKLTINASSDDFPTEKDLNALCNLKALQKLTIAWGAKQGNNGEAKPKQGNNAEPGTPAKAFDNSSKSTTMKLPEQLEKLDLLCFPKSHPPFWLDPVNLKNVTKLYIRGGSLQTLGNHKIHTWAVDTLCLKFLSEFKMNWRQLQQNFPKLVYLKKVGCPRITFCPSDGNGVWLKNEQIA